MMARVHRSGNLSPALADSPGVRERIQAFVVHLLDRLDEQWADDGTSGRWSGACWCAFGRYVPANAEPHEGRRI